MKIAISVPDGLFEAGEHLARQLGVSRSQLYRDALARYLSERGATEVTARLNCIYSTERSEIEPVMVRPQLDNVTDEAW